MARDREPESGPEAAHEEGSASAVLLGAVALWAALLMLVLGLMSARAAGLTAQAGADLSAIAAADAARGLAPGEPCEVARRIAQENRTEVIACRVEGQTVRVSVGRKTGIAGLGRPVIREARAGPPSAGR